MAHSSATLIVADSGPLIGLTKLGLLELLPRCFDAVYIPRTVLSEATGSRTHPDAETLLRFIAANDGGRIRMAPDTVTQLTLELGKWLDPGETQAINLAHDLGCPVLLDEKRGRMLAARYGIPVFGLLGLLVRAKQTRQIAELAPYPPLLRQAGYHLSDRLISEALRLAGEAHD
jgi:predicted nucleic acid-binding protein